METRLTWAEVHCGKVSGFLCYYTDQLVGKGGNLIVEVTRQALSDLAQLLADVNQVMPKRGVLCYDNGGENKCKQVFCYAATLVESRCFEDIFIHFLIVGHTHNLLDQVFSAVSTYLNEARFIGTPLTVEEIIRQKLPSHYQPLLVKKIRVVYDFLGAITPIMSKIIKYHGLPQHFHFCLRHSKAICFYRMLHSLPWKPDEPPALKDLADLKQLSITANNFSLLGGREYFYAHFRINAADFVNEVDANRKRIQELLKFEETVMPELFQGTVRDIERGLLRSLKEFSDELREDDQDDEDADEDKVSLDDLIKASNKDEGYLLWLVNADPRELETIQVQPILPSAETIALVRKEKGAVDDQDDGEAEKDTKKVQRKTTLTPQQRFVKGARTFAAAANSVLTDPRFEKCTDGSEEIWKQRIGLDFKVYPAEIRFLNDHSSPSRILERLVEYARSLPPWSPFIPPQHVRLNSEAAAQLNARVEKASEEVADLLHASSRFLKGDKYLSGEHVNRHGFTSVKTKEGGAASE